jgi:hypothetical protein
LVIPWAGGSTASDSVTNLSICYRPAGPGGVSILWMACIVYSPPRHWGRFNRTSAQTFYEKAMRRTVATLASWLRTERERGLIAIEDPDIAAGVLLGMLAFEPQRPSMFGEKPPPRKQEVRHWAQVCAALFLIGARNPNVRRTPAAQHADS